MNIKRGILLIATTHPYYGRMAYNLALTIKANTNLSIAIVADKKALSHLSDHQTKVFDSIISTNGYGVDLKIDAYDLSPFQETVLMDVDMIVTTDRFSGMLDNIFSVTEFTATNEGYFNINDNLDCTSKKYTWWAPLKDVLLHYKLKDRIYQMRSEMIFFKKTARVKKMFVLAKKIHDNPKVKPLSFGRSIPDELALNIAASLSGLFPHVSNFQPAYWSFLHKSQYPNIYDLKENYVALSMGGNGQPIRATVDLYDNIVGAAANKLGAMPGFKPLSKKLLMPERAIL
jgi:hypothetical protein